MTEHPDETCDTRIWGPQCEREEFSSKEEKYLCVSCGKIHHLDHEVHHEVFPHVVGDEDNMS